MASEIDWEKRAREIIPGMGAKTVRMEDFFDELAAAVLKLGNEMADARAEEIAKAIQSQEVERVKSNPTGAAYLSAAADIARSFISKKKECHACGRPY